MAANTVLNERSRSFSYTCGIGGGEAMNMRESFENDYPLHPSTMFNGLAYIVDLPFILDANFPPETGAMIAIIQQARWEAWQASRAAIVLPEPPHGDSFVTLQQVKQAIGVDVR